MLHVIVDIFVCKELYDFDWGVIIFWVDPRSGLNVGSVIYLRMYKSVFMSRNCLVGYLSTSRSICVHKHVYGEPQMPPILVLEFESELYESFISED